jgi:hypothetical protein
MVVRNRDEILVFGQGANSGSSFEASAHDYQGKSKYLDFAVRVRVPGTSIQY